MTPSIYPSHTATPGWPRTALHRLAAFVWEALALAARSLARRRARRELLEVPDFLLRDMGLSRSEIPSIVWYGLDDGTRIHRGHSGEKEG